MNRRNFLKSIGKICAVLPFVGSSSAVAKTGASEGQRRSEPTKAELLDVLAEGLRKKYDGQAQDECERLYKIECMRIEAAQKAVNPPIILNPNAANEYQWHRHNDCEWHCKHRNLPMEFVTRDEYDLFTSKMI